MMFIVYKAKTVVSTILPNWHLIFGKEMSKLIGEHFVQSSEAKLLVLHFHILVQYICSFNATCKQLYSKLCNCVTKYILVSLEGHKTRKRYRF